VRITSKVCIRPALPDDPRISDSLSRQARHESNEARWCEGCGRLMRGHSQTTVDFIRATVDFIGRKKYETHQTHQTRSLPLFSSTFRLKTHTHSHTTGLCESDKEVGWLCVAATGLATMPQPLSVGSAL
jgi:hypothetical protein